MTAKRGECLLCDYWSCSDVGGRLKWNASVEELSRQHNLSKTDVPKLAKLVAMRDYLASVLRGVNRRSIHSVTQLTPIAWASK
jgi:hypothetical protein